MSEPADELGRVWRVGRREAPLAFVPTARRSWSHRFDDLHRRFGTLYCALLPETALREVLADLRPNAAAIARYIRIHGSDAAGDVPSAPVTAAWRQRHVLAPARLELDGPLVDLTDVVVRRELELHHAALIAEHGLAHLDLHEITSSRRSCHADDRQRCPRPAPRRRDPVRVAAGRPGLPCYALFEGRARLRGDGEPVALTDPTPEPLQNVSAAWQLALEPTPAPAATPPDSR